MPSYKSKVAFVFSGIGSQWKQMGKDLLEDETFREAIAECDHEYAQISNLSIFDMIYKEGISLENTVIGNPCLLAVDIAIVKMLKNLGIEPDGIIGHSTGEFAAAYTAGVLSLEQTFKALHSHCQYISHLLSGGIMAHIGLPASEVEGLLTPYAGKVTIAAINSPKATVISGDEKIVKKIVSLASKKETFCKILKIDIPFHQEKLASTNMSMDDIKPCKAAKPLYSSLRGAFSQDNDYDAKYWEVHIHKPVLFSAALNVMIQDGYRTFIEISPHPLLSVSISECLDALNIRGRVTYTLKRGEKGMEGLLRVRDVFSSMDLEDHKYISHGANILMKINQADPTDRRDLIIDFIKSSIQRISKQEVIPQDLSQGFLEMGITSIMAVEIRNFLEDSCNLSLSASIIFDYPNIYALSDYLLSRLDKKVESGSPNVHVSHKKKNNDNDDSLIAVVGMGCRFPGGANNPHLFWDILIHGKDGICKIPKERFDAESFYDPNPNAAGKMITKYGGFLSSVDIEAFDEAFFGISPQEAKYLDPQQKLLLEVTWEAFHDAGISIQALKEKQVGVYVGICSNDFMRNVLWVNDLRDINVYSGTGSVFSCLAGRLSYVFNFQGPNFPVDTACSSSLVALDAACKGLKLHESDIAVAAGIHLLIHPHLFIYLSKVGALSPDGKCKAFDASANGYGRGEGCGVLILKRLSDAKQNKDHILAVIRGSGVNHDGQSSSFTAPNGSAQQKLIRKVLHDASLNPEQISYVEAHGTGTVLGDPIEVNALSSVYSLNRNRANPLIIGSVKANIGHLEGAAGISSLIKVILALNHEMIPPQINFLNPNPLIPWQNIPVTIPVKPTPWHRTDIPRMAGINSFGLSGTNVHVIVEEPPHSVEQRPKVTWKSPFKRKKIALKRLETKLISAPMFPGQKIRHGNTIIFQSVFDKENPDFLNAHRIYEKIVSPAAAHLSMVLSAVKNIHGTSQCTISDINFSHILAIEENKDRIVQVIIEDGKMKTSSFNITSMDKELEEATQHCFGKLQVDDRDNMHYEKIEIEEIKERCPGRIGKEYVYDRFQKAGYNLGRHFQCIEECWSGNCEALSLLRVDKESLNHQAYGIHPGTIDSFFQSTLLSLMERVEHMISKGVLYIPYHLTELKCYSHPFTETLWSHSKIRPGENILTSDCTIWNEKQEILIEIKNLVSKDIQKSTLLSIIHKDPLADLLYSTYWKETDKQEIEGMLNPLTCIIFSDSQRVSDQIIVQLEKKNITCITIYPGDTFQQIDAQTFMINPLSMEDCLQVFNGIYPEGAYIPVLFLLGMNERCIDDTTTFALEKMLEYNCQSLLNLVKTILNIDKSERFKVWLLSVNDHNSVLCQNSLWGLGRVISSEHTELWGGCIELEDSQSDACLAMLLQEIQSMGKDDQISFTKDGKRYVLRLRKEKGSVSNENKIILKKDATYLITGGTGDLGLVMGRWLIDKGAGYIVLISRNKPKPDVQSEIQKLKDKGACVYSEQADVSYELEMSELISRISKALPPIKGVIHSAGVIDDGALIHQNWERFKKVIHPKVLGAWNLHRLTKDMALDFFIMCSSMASLLGSKGQSNYAAANSFLDGLAHYRRKQGLSAVSINWGPWDQTRMVSNVKSNLSLQGIILVKQEEYLLALEKILMLGASQMGVMRCDWNQMVKRIPDSKKVFFSDLTGKRTGLEGKNAKLIGLCNQIITVELSERKKIITDYLSQTLKELSGIDDFSDLEETSSLQSLGVDSLMAVELRSRIKDDLNVEIPIVELIQESVMGLCNLLNEMLISGSGNQWIEGEV
ncbi:MAG: SDR family NAD(P)-dependent oxidoreductase [Desulfobacterales bacterium]|nr:SDR family NAD(P)-dependent oxidoreductase [Desulfobacterales bacterium]